MQLGDAISARVKAKDGKAEVDMFHWMARTALELIGQGGLGYSFDPLTSDRHDVLGEALRNFMCYISTPVLAPHLASSVDPPPSNDK